MCLCASLSGAAWEEMTCRGGGIYFGSTHRSDAAAAVTQTSSEQVLIARGVGWVDEEVLHY